MEKLIVKFYTNIINLRQVLVQLFFLRTSRLSRQFSGEGIRIPSPSQQRKYIRLFNKAAKVKQHLISTFQRKNWSLHFVNKQIQGIGHKFWFEKDIKLRKSS